MTVIDDDDDNDGGGGGVDDEGDPDKMPLIIPTKGW